MGEGVKAGRLSLLCRTKDENGAMTSGATVFKPSKYDGTIATQLLCKQSQ
jgi:hypothetical protein